MSNTGLRGYSATANLKLFAASIRSFGEPFLSSSKASMLFEDIIRAGVGVALTNSVLGRTAGEDDEESGGGDLDDFEFVNPRKTLARPPGRDDSDECVSSPD